MGKVFVTDLIADNDLTFIINTLSLWNIRHTTLLDVVKIPMAIEQKLLSLYALLLILLSLELVAIIFPYLEIVTT